jgi:hypothetical protein
MDIPEQLLGLVRVQSTQDVPPGITALADAARSLHGESVRAVLLYGSTLRTGNVHDGLADLYLLVDDYRQAFVNRPLAFLNWLLPPNVFYLEVPFQGQVLRAKYAILTFSDFRKGAECWFHSYLWGRFSQKSVLVYTHGDLVTRQVQEILATAVTTFVRRTLPQMEASFSARDLWARGLSLSYRAELRSEQPEGSARLFDADPEYYESLTNSLLEGSPYVLHIKTDTDPNCYQMQIPPRVRHLNGIAWRARILQGKLLSILRLLKGLLTFKGGIEYILWKIERHSGVRIEIGAKLRQVPPLAIIIIFWRLYRRNAFR